MREDLSHPQQIVQASHAALEAGFRFEKPAEVSSIVLIGVKNEQELMNVAGHLQKHMIEHELFFEPDYDTGYTAIATRPLFDDERKPLRRFSLLKQQPEELS